MAELEALVAALQKGGLIVTVNRPASANPGPLALYGFALTTAMLQGVKSGLVAGAGASCVWGMGLFFGGLAQFVGGLLEYPRRNTFGLVAFCCYGGFWMGLSIMEVLVAGGVLPAPPREAVAMFLSLWGIVTFLLWLCSLHLTLVTSSLLLTLSILFWALAAGEYHPAVQQGAGGFGFFVALLAFYDATAALMQEMYGCPILPTVPLKPLWDRLALGAHGGSHAKLANVPGPCVVPLSAEAV